MEFHVDPIVSYIVISLDHKPVTFYMIFVHFFGCENVLYYLTDLIARYFISTFFVIIPDDCVLIKYHPVSLKIIDGCLKVLV
jgi:hypothetical protein